MAWSSRRLTVVGLGTLLLMISAGCEDRRKATGASAVQEATEGRFGAGAVIGRVMFTGTPTATHPITASSQTNDQACIAMHGDRKIPDDSFVLNANGTLRNVFVSLEGVQGSYAPPTDVVKLAQNGCLFRPRVFGVMVGQKVSIRNEDPTFHNVKTVTRDNSPINLAQAIGRADVVTFAHPEMMIEVRCDVHPWMHAYCGVMSHPFYAVTGDDGTFRIERVPPGQYKLTAWHETLGRKTIQVTVKDNATEDVVFAYTR